MKRLVSLLLLMVILMSSSREDGFTVFMIGDSTMANKDTTCVKQ